MRQLMYTPTDSHVELTAVAVSALNEARSLVDSHLDEFVEQYYLRLTSYHHVTIDKELVSRMQRQYLHALFSGRFDERHIDLLREIGRQYFRAGLDIRCYARSCAMYLDYFIPLLRKKFNANHFKQSEAQAAFQKVVLLDMSFVLEAYDRCGDSERAVRLARNLQDPRRREGAGLLPALSK